MNRRRFLLALILGVSLLHAAALFTFGSTFWVDSGIYASLGDALLIAKKLKLFYDTPGLLTYSHFSPGEPALWAATSFLPVAWRWPALAVFQHLLAILATCWLFATAHRLWPSWWHLAGALLLSLHPFYQSMHDALMTESITSSVLLMATALTLRLLFFEGRRRGDFAALLVLTVVAAQFRTYSGAMLAGLAAFVLWQRRSDLRWPAAAALLAACAAGALLFPSYRFALTGRWLMPGLGTNTIVIARWTITHPSPALLARLRGLGTISEEKLAALFAPGFDYDAAAELGATWMAGGASLKEVNARAARIAKEIQADAPELWRLKVRSALSSCGFSWLGFAGPDHGPVYQNRSLPEQQRHRLEHYRWLSWLQHGSYRHEGEGLVRGFHTALFNSARAQRALWKALEPHFADCPIRWRDPLGLGFLWPDVFAALGLLGAALCFWRCWPVGVIVTLPLAVNFAVMVLVAFGGPRYAYGMLPLAIFALTTGLALSRPYTPLMCSRRPAC